MNTQPTVINKVFQVGLGETRKQFPAFAPAHGVLAVIGGVVRLVHRLENDGTVRIEKFGFSNGHFDNFNYISSKGTAMKSLF